MRHFPDSKALYAEEGTDHYTLPGSVVALLPHSTVPVTAYLLDAVPVSTSRPGSQAHATETLKRLESALTD